jgi:hypothetical protein
MSSLALSNVAIVIQLAVGLMFGLSAVAKLADVRGFFWGLAEYGIVKPAAYVSVGLALIALELLLAAAHLTGHLIDFSLLVGCATFGAFLVVVSIKLVQGRNTPCLCFGTTSGQPISILTVTRLALLLSAELFLLSLSASGHLWPAILELDARRILSAALVAFAGALCISWLITLCETLLLVRRAGETPSLLSSR